MNCCLRNPIDCECNLQSDGLWPAHRPKRHAIQQAANHLQPTRLLTREVIGQLVLFTLPDIRCSFHQCGRVFTPPADEPFELTDVEAEVRQLPGGEPAALQVGL